MNEPTNGGSPSLMDQVISQTPDGERLRTCLQCGTCGGSCPNGPDMDYTPRALFALIAADERQAVLRANTMWMCVSCYFCSSRCPKQIPITDIMYTLKRLSVKEEMFADPDAVALARHFHHFIDRYGRSFELGVATRYYLRRHPLKLIGLSGLGMKLFGKGRMHLTPKKIEQTKQLAAILDKARELEDAR